MWGSVWLLVLYVGGAGLISELYLQAWTTVVNNDFYPKEKKEKDRRSELRGMEKKRSEGLRTTTTLWIRILVGESL